MLCHIYAAQDTVTQDAVNHEKITFTAERHIIIRAVEIND